MRRLLLAAALLLGFAVPAGGPAWAQASAGSVLITQVDSTAFPAMTAYLAVNDAGGQRFSGLASSAFRLTENGAPAANPAVTEAETGVQIVLAFDPSEPFSARDAAGLTRLDYLRQALTTFATSTPGIKEGVDDVTLLTPGGPLAEHSHAGAAVAAALAGYGEPLALAADPLPLLNRAVDYAADPAARPGMRRYIIYMSGGLVIADHQAAVNDLAVRANAAQIQIDTLYVGPAEGAQAAGGRGLEQLARLTTGAFLIFEKPASLTPLFQLLADQRTQYKLSYRSALNLTGQHPLVASVDLPDGTALTSPPSIVALRVEPPLVTLGDLPAQMDQTVTPLVVPFAVDFADGHPRELRVFELVVDGETVDRQTVMTGVLRWPTIGYTRSGEHVVSVRAVDELGLSAESAPRTVTVNVTAPIAAAAMTGLFSPPGLAVLAGAGLALALGLFFVFRTRFARPQPLPVTRTQPAPPPAPVVSPAPQLGAAVQPESALPPVSARLAQAAPAGGDTQPRAPLAHVLDDTRPVQPVGIATRAAEPPLAGKASSPAAPSSRAGARRPVVEKKELGRAYLEVLEPGGGGAPRPDIEILKAVLKIGRDPAQSEAAFDDRSVSRLHARLVEEGNAFKIYDERSTSGTWVNLEQIPVEGGRELKDGDVINLGRVQLRFRRRQ